MATSTSPAPGAPGSGMSTISIVLDGIAIGLQLCGRHRHVLGMVVRGHFGERSNRRPLIEQPDRLAPPRGFRRKVLERDETGPWRQPSPRSGFVPLWTGRFDERARLLVF